MHSSTKLPTVIGILLCVGIIFFSCTVDKAHVPAGDKMAESTNSTKYDSVLAQKLGADSYGMKAYVMAFLKVGPNRSQDSTEAAGLQRAHLDNIFRLAEEGKLVLAGPFLDTGEIRGIYVFNVSSLQEAEALTASDPAIQAGRLVMELHPWYGSASLQMLNDLHKKVQRLKI